MSFQVTGPNFTPIQDTHTHTILCNVIVTFLKIRYSELTTIIVVVTTCTRRHIPQELIPQQHRCRTLTFHDFNLFFLLPNINNFARFEACTGHGLSRRLRPASQRRTRHQHVTNERQKLETTTTSSAH
jgi:hypothetical protein